MYQSMQKFVDKDEYDGMFEKIRMTTRKRRKREKLYECWDCTGLE